MYERVACWWELEGRLEASNQHRSKPPPPEGVERSLAGATRADKGSYSLTVWWLSQPCWLAAGWRRAGSVPDHHNGNPQEPEASSSAGGTNQAAG